MKLFVITLLLVGINNIQAQSSLNAAGGNYAGNGGSVSSSIGQTFYTTITGISGSVSQGVQQPYEIWIVTGTNHAEVDLGIYAYPNPSYGWLILKVENAEKEVFSYELLDINGKVLESKYIETNETRIDMNAYPAATYFLKVMHPMKEIKTFKIFKN